MAGRPGVAPVDDLLDVRCGAERVVAVRGPHSGLALLRLVAMSLLGLFGQVPLPQRDEGLDLSMRQSGRRSGGTAERLTNPTSANNFGNIQIPGLATITVIM